MSDCAIAERKLEIIKTIWNYLLKKGLAEASVGDLCRETKLSQSSLYHWFVNKDDIWISAGRYGISKVVEALFAFTLEHIDKVDEYFESLLDEIEKHKYELRLAIQITTSPVFGERMRDKSKEFRMFYEMYAHKLMSLCNCNYLQAEIFIYSVISFIIDFAIWDDREKTQMLVDNLHKRVKRNLGEIKKEEDKKINETEDEKKCIISRKKKICALAMVILMMTAILTSTTALAAENVEIVLTDVTQDDQTTLKGEAKLKVSVKGVEGKVTAVQTALKFAGDLKYKAIEFLQGENNPPKCFFIPPNTALANSTKKLMPSIATNNAGALNFTGELTDLFIITFAGEAGKKVEVSLNDESAAGTYFAVGGNYISPSNLRVSKEIVASNEEKRGVEATVKVIMDVVNDFTVSRGNGYQDSKITLTITNEETGATYSTVLNTVSNLKGGHYDSDSSIPTFIVKNNVVAGSYTVELTGKGYKTYKQSGIDFEQPFEIRNAQFAPGDINSDGKVDILDKTAFEEIKAGDYSNYDLDSADFNRDGRVNNFDDVFKNIVVPEITVPAKMATPTITGGDKEITVSWTAPENGGSDITGYVLQYGVNRDDLNTTKEVGAAATGETISSLLSDTLYYCRIAAKNAVGTGEYSAIAVGKTNKEQASAPVIIPPTGGGGGGGGGGGAFVPAEPVQPEVKPESEAKPADNEFKDIDNYDWAKDSIYTLKQKGIINGVSATEFAPANNIKRGDFILILTRILSLNDEFTENFADVPSDSYYYAAIGSAKAAGIAGGDGYNFMPEKSITRQDLITLAYRAFLAKGYIKETGDMSSLEQFADKTDISDYAKTAMASMVASGIIKGSDGNVNPLGNATRAEVAVMCARLLNLME